MKMGLVGFAGTGKSTVFEWLTGEKPDPAKVQQGQTGMAKVPATYETDREAIETALSCIGLTPPERARVVRIKNTLLLGEIEVSEAYAAEVDKRRDLTVLGESPLGFDASGRLRPL